MKVKPGGVRQGIESQQYYIDYPVSGLVATDGVQYSTVVTFGTVAAEIFNFLVDPGFNMGLKWLKFGGTQRFTGLNGSFVASISYYWRAREEFVEEKGASPTRSVGAWATLGLITKGVGTLVAVEDSLSGNVSLIKKAPFRISLMAAGIQAAVCKGEVKSSTYIEMVGNVLPGV